MDSHALRVLEFPAVLELVCRQTHWSLGRQTLEAFQPCNDLYDLSERQAEVAEGLELVESGSGLTLGGLQDVRDPIKAAAKGSVLGPGVLLDVLELIAASRRSGRLLHGQRQQCPRLAGRGEILTPFPKLESAIKNSIGPDQRVLDTASPRLGKLRLEVRRLEGQVQSTLQNILRRGDIARLLQEPIVTQRNGRHVVPVKADHRGQFPGLVIDQSASGATVFMEPYSVVELGNKLRSAELAEEKEVEAVLAGLSGRVGEESHRLLEVANTLGYLDAILALARYAVEAGANLPEVKEDCALRLVNARHPLLGRDCVPISIEVGDGFTTLVITGPNTGGKTVGLKTVGLLAVMALCGMPIPASSGTTVPLLTGVWADIGDEQSIAQSLSTFSAHLTQILRILPQSGPRTLVLLDELGAGTDPAEGSALGIALLDYLNAQGGLTVLTTHLSQLKVHAAQTPGFQNAAVEFDAASLSPTFRILMGIPGRSNALAIADRLGLPREVLRRAREHLGQDHAGVEGLLDDLEHERDAVRALEGRLEVENRELSELRRAYEEKMRAARDERERLLAEASVEAGRLVEDARKKVTGLLQDFRTRMKALGQARRDALEQARQLTEELAQRVEPPPEPSQEELEAPLEEAEEEGFDEQFATTETPAEPEPDEDVVDEVARREARQVEAALAQLDEQLAPYRPAPKPADASAPLEPGTAVYARRYGQDGEVISHKGDRVEVRLGAVRMTVDRDDLEVIEARREATQIRLPESGRDKVSTRVDLRGLTVDEALFELDRYLDAAAMARSDKLEVIHGKGTGALRNAVQSHLRQHTLVADYRLGEVHEGGWGVTVVKLRI